MYTIKVRSEFNSAHNLRGYEGKCEELHGHNWRVELELTARELDRHGMVMDFKDVKGMLNKVLSELDHRYLNRTGYFREVNPTSENIAKYIYDRCAAGLSGPNILKVTVWETDSSSASYSPFDWDFQSRMG